MLENCPFHALAERHTDLICGANLRPGARNRRCDGDDRDVALEPRSGDAAWRCIRAPPDRRLVGPDAASRPADGKTQNFRIRSTTAAAFSSSSQTRPRSQHLPRSHQVGGGHDGTPDAVAAPMTWLREARAQRGHPRAQLPGAGDPGHRRLRWRLAGPELPGGEDRRGRDPFCGVHFMAETAKIINPTKRSSCPISTPAARSPSRARRRSSRRISSSTRRRTITSSPTSIASAGVKALCDVICTSGNAEKIVNAAPEDRNILFVPDQNLGAWVMEKTGRHDGPVAGELLRARRVHGAESSIGFAPNIPDAPVVAHPECTFAVPMLADEVCSTEKMVSYCKAIPARDVHHRHGIRHAAPIAPGDVRTRLSSRGRLIAARAPSAVS